MNLLSRKGGNSMALNMNETRWYAYTSSTETMKTWAQLLSSYAEVPEQFRAAFPEPVTSFPYTVLIPGDPFSYVQRRHEKLVCLYGDHLDILETVGERANVRSYPFHEILYLKQGRILLNSWMTIATRSGLATVAFNTVNVHHFEPIMQKIRQGMIQGQSGNGHGRQEPTGLEYLSTLNYKFMNYGRQSIRADETVVKAVYQPDRCVKTLAWVNSIMFRQSTKGYLTSFANYAKTLHLFTKPRVSLYAPSHLSILTDQELILIKEGKRIKMEQENLYGGVTTYIPLQNIQDISFAADSERSRCIMTVMLPEHICVRSEFALGSVDLEVFKQEYSKIRANA
jgi:hypothetical protein